MSDVVLLLGSERSREVLGSKTHGERRKRGDGSSNS